MGKKPSATKVVSDEPEWVPPPYPKPAIQEFGWMDMVDAVLIGWVDDSPEGLDARKAKLQEFHNACKPEDIYSRHFYLQEKHWVEWVTTKHQVLNSYIYSVSCRASRLRLGIK